MTRKKIANWHTRLVFITGVALPIALLARLLQGMTDSVSITVSVIIIVIANIALAFTSPDYSYGADEAPLIRDTRLFLFSSIAIAFLYVIAVGAGIVVMIRNNSGITTILCVVMSLIALPFGFLALRLTSPDDFEEPFPSSTPLVSPLDPSSDDDF
jgi:predicted MFS family arabinose efflux permease